MTRTRMWELARAVVATRACPTCEVPRGQRCVSLSRRHAVRDRDNAKPIAIPHKERYPAGNTTISAPANLALIDVERCLRCNHLVTEHGRNRCLALLDDGSDEPCPCGRGFKP